jgi:hypothetical protein
MKSATLYSAQRQRRCGRQGLRQQRRASRGTFGEPWDPCQ